MHTNVMFTDIVGYSKLTGDDQNLALELLKEHDKIIEPIIHRYNGVIVKRIGDAIVATFNEHQNIIQSSIEIQQSLKNRNNRNIKSRHIILRIGLHHGEIILENDEVYGTGYELASNIEPICEYGGITISDDLYNVAHQNNELIVKGGKNHFFVRPIGIFDFKSSNKPKIMYKLYLNLLDWYDEDVDQAGAYLLNQGVDSTLYKSYELNKHINHTLDHYQLAQNFESKHDLSYAVYHYKIHLDYLVKETKERIETELHIIKIFSYCGLIRLTNRVLELLENFDFDFEKNYLYNYIQGLNAFNNTDYNLAFINFEKCIDIQDQQLSQNCYYYLLFILMKNQDYDKAHQLIYEINKTLKASSEQKIIFDCISNIFLFFSKPNTQLENKIKNFDLKIITDISISSQKDSLFLYWFLIEFYKKIKDINKAMEIQDFSRETLDLLTNYISGFQLKLFFNEKPILHQLLIEELEFQFIENDGLDDFSEPDQVRSEPIDVFNFCTECGFNNDNKFQFCPSCGAKLTK